MTIIEKNGIVRSIKRLLFSGSCDKSILHSFALIKSYVAVRQKLPAHTSHTVSGEAMICDWADGIY